MSEHPPGDPGPDLGWLLDDLAGRVSHFQQAVILSKDGLVIASSAGLPRDDAERMSALAAGVQSLAAGAGPASGRGERQGSPVRRSALAEFCSGQICRRVRQTSNGSAMWARHHRLARVGKERGHGACTTPSAAG